MNEFERSWTRFRTYHEVNGMQPTIERWKWWVERENRQATRGKDRSIQREAVVSVLLVAVVVGAGAIGAGVAYVLDRALCTGGLQ